MLFCIYLQFCLCTTNRLVSQSATWAEPASVCQGGKGGQRAGHGGASINLTKNGKITIYPVVRSACHLSQWTYSILSVFSGVFYRRTGGSRNLVWGAKSPPLLSPPYSPSFTRPCPPQPPLPHPTLPFLHSPLPPNPIVPHSLPVPSSSSLPPAPLSPLEAGVRGYYPRGNF